MELKTSRREGFAKQLVMAVILVMIIICISIALTVVFRPLYYFDMGHLGISEETGIPESICRQNYDVLMDYNLLGGPSVLKFPDFTMSEQGRIHFQEVKRIFIAAQLGAIMGSITVFLRIAFQRWRKDYDYRWLKWAGWVALALVAVIGGLMAVSWENAFVLMHKILFRNDFWLFNAKTDPIIRVLPDQFFMHCGILIIVLVVLLVVCCRVLACKLEKGKDSC
ncbi:MAG: TIGR01906 family membrane protein [Firmicutes bacterium]|nr:TIGR01906 family membrane protein [Bacillota bacterium]